LQYGLFVYQYWGETHFGSVPAAASGEKLEFRSIKRRPRHM
jgi:hypothetical protein